MARAGDDAASLLAHADEALHRSRVAGRDRVTVIEETDADPMQPGGAAEVSSAGG